MMRRHGIIEQQRQTKGNYTCQRTNAGSCQSLNRPNEKKRIVSREKNRVEEHREQRNGDNGIRGRS